MEARAAASLPSWPLSVQLWKKLRFGKLAPKNVYSQGASWKTKPLKPDVACNHLVMATVGMLSHPELRWAGIVPPDGGGLLL